MCDKKQNQVKTSFLGMQKDDDWILTGFYTDSTRMRDNLGYKFWDAINENRQDAVKTASYKFVEVYINNIYRGIYALMEPMNGKHFHLGRVIIYIRYAVGKFRQTMYSICMSGFQTYITKMVEEQFQ